jgi:hypothetical protein|tara:strand:- start:801 stop:953 length:153 start_codon:yes stop_codon:yes gene_type:complete
MAATIGSTTVLFVAFFLGNEQRPWEQKLLGQEGNGRRQDQICQYLLKNIH